MPNAGPNPCCSVPLASDNWAQVQARTGLRKCQGCTHRWNRTSTSFRHLSSSLLVAHKGHRTTCRLHPASARRVLPGTELPKDRAQHPLNRHANSSPRTDEAWRILYRIGSRHSSRHASWLKVAETVIAVLKGRCLSHCIGHETRSMHRLRPGKGAGAAASWRSAGRPTWGMPASAREPESALPRPLRHDIQT